MGADEVVALRLALGVLRALQETSAGASTVRDELLALLADDLDGQRWERGPSEANR